MAPVCHASGRIAATGTAPFKHNVYRISAPFFHSLLCFFFVGSSRLFRSKDPNEETEWNDILRKHKIIGARQKTELELNAEAAEEMLAAHVENIALSQGGRIATEASTKDELDALLEDVTDDDEEKVRLERSLQVKSRLVADITSPPPLPPLIPISRVYLCALKSVSFPVHPSVFCVPALSGFLASRFATAACLASHAILVITFSLLVLSLVL